MPSDEASASLFDRWLGKASENIAEWGRQDEATLLLAMQEELGELTQAHLEARHEDGDGDRAEQELDDLGALLLQFHEVRRDTPSMAPPEATTTEPGLEDGAYHYEVEAGADAGYVSPERRTFILDGDSGAGLPEKPGRPRFSDSMVVDVDLSDIDGERIQNELERWAEEREADDAE